MRCQGWRGGWAKLLTAGGRRGCAAAHLLEHEGEVDGHVAAGARECHGAADLPSDVVVLVLDGLEQCGEQRLRVRGGRRPAQPEQPEQRVGGAQPPLDLRGVKER